MTGRATGLHENSGGLARPSRIWSGDAATHDGARDHQSRGARTGGATASSRKVERLVRNQMMHLKCIFKKTAR